MRIKTTGYCSKAYPTMGAPYREFTRVAYVADEQTGEWVMAGWLLARTLETPMTDYFVDYSMEDALRTSDDDLKDYEAFFVALRHNIDNIQAQCHPNRLWHHPVGVLTLLIILPAFRRQGIGTRLVNDIRSSELGGCQSVVTLPQPFAWDDPEGPVGNPENLPLTLADVQVGVCDPLGGFGVPNFWDQCPGVEAFPRARTGLADGSRYRVFHQNPPAHDYYGINRVNRGEMFNDLEDEVTRRLDAVGASGDGQRMEKEGARLRVIMEKILERREKKITVTGTRTASCNTHRRYFSRTPLSPRETAKNGLQSIARTGILSNHGLNTDAGYDLIEWIIRTFGEDQAWSVLDEYLDTVTEKATA